jgi:hypothetical protein
MSDRQKVFLAILASLFVHAVIALSMWRVRHVDDTDVSTDRHRAVDLSRLVVTIMPPKAADVNKRTTAAARPTPPPPVKPFIPPVMDSDGLKTSAKAPDHAIFQSDSNMVAGSLLPPTGNIPLPTIVGPHRNFTQFDDRPASLGKGEVPSQMTRPPQAVQPPSSMPEQTPFAVTQVQHPPAAESTPTPKPIPTPGPDMLALGTPTPTPPPPIRDLARLTLRGQADMAPMTQPQQPPAAQPVHPLPPSPPLPAPNTQQETARTHTDGGITTPGAPSVDAVETPYGRYHREVSNLIGSRWQLYLQAHPRDIGDVSILVKVDTSGKVIGTQVLANHSLDDLAEFSTRAIMESDLPPVPDDLAPYLKNGKLEITFTFTVYDKDK